jgi:hypothetical protein
MNCILALIVLGGLATAQLSVADARAQTAGQQSTPRSTRALDSPALPTAPNRKSTVLGGEIKRVDSVRDALIMEIFGQHPIEVFFDQRTHVYLDGKPIPLGALSPANHASVETVLDGTHIYAISIHMLSRLSEGKYQGQLINYNPDTREMEVSAVLSRQPIQFLVPANTLVVRQSQGVLPSAPSSTSDLIKGALISIGFTSDKRGQGVASHITILAYPGSAFVFSGSLSALDTHSGLLVLVDPRDNKSYQIYFDPTELPASQNLHEGDNVRVTAKYDGTRYVASALTAD